MPPIDHDSDCWKVHSVPNCSDVLETGGWSNVYIKILQRSDEMSSVNVASDYILYQFICECCIWRYTVPIYVYISILQRFEVKSGHSYYFWWTEQESKPNQKPMNIFLLQSKRHDQMWQILKFEFWNDQNTFCLLP